MRNGSLSKKVFRWNFLLILAAWSSVQAAETSDTSSSSLAEIVVTATKRAENLQDVPVSMSVISGAAMLEQQKSQLSDYLAYAPGVTVASTGSPGQSAITVRGISPLGGTRKVATYIDEAPLGSSGIWAQSGGLTLDLLPFDLDRLEVLRGPQGTLYGASSMGGLLKYVLTTPDTHAFSGAVSADAAGVQSAGGAQASVMAHVNIPLIEDLLAASVSGFYKYTPGYIDNAYSGEHNTNDLRQYGGRLAVYWQPTSALSVKFNAMLQVTESADDAVESFAEPTATATPTSPIFVSGGTPYGKYTESEAFTEPFESTLKYFSVTANWDLDFADLISASSYSRLIAGQTYNQSQEFGNFYPLVGIPAGLAYEFNKFDLQKITQEIRLTSPQTQFLSWQVGAFFTDERQGNEQKVGGLDTSFNPIPEFVPYLAYANIPTVYKEYAVFGDVTWNVSSSFDVTGGVRYSKNKQGFQITEAGLLLNQPQSPPTLLPAVPSTESNTTWMGNARYHFTKDVMAYVRAATGYAPGGANTPYPGVPQATVGSEKLTSYEVGLKTEFLDHRLLVDADIYHIDWKNIQLGALLNGVGYVTNGGKARSDGVELSTSFSPFKGLTFAVNSAYTDAHLTSLNPDVSTPFVLDTQLQNVSKWTLSGNADYGWSLTSSLAAHIGGGIRWVGRQTGQEPAVGEPYFDLPSYTMLDANGSVVSGPWTFRVFANNLNNARAYTYGRMHQDAVFGNIPQLDYFLSQPRTIGGGFTFKF